VGTNPFLAALASSDYVRSRSVVTFQPVRLSLLERLLVARYRVGDGILALDRFVSHSRHLPVITTVENLERERVQSG
jgi:hypothetical protein